MADLDVDLGTATRLSLTLLDGATDKFPRATIYAGSPAPVAVVDLAHTAQGMYRAPWTPPSAALFNVVYSVFADAGHTVPADYEPAEASVEALVPPDEPAMGAGYDVLTDTLRVDTWLLRRGAQVLSVTACEVRVYSADDTLLFTLADASPDAQGVFRMTKLAPGLVENTNYSCAVKITLATHVVEGRRGFKTVT